MCTRTVSTFWKEKGRRCLAISARLQPARVQKRKNRVDNPAEKRTGCHRFMYRSYKGDNMSMQEFGQEEQERLEQGIYQVDYMGSYEAERQKIHPVEGQGQSAARHIVAIVLSSVGFVFSILGVVGSAIVLQAARIGDNFEARPPHIAGGVLGLVGSILAMLVFIAIFVVALVLLARRIALRRGAGRISSHSRSVGSLGNMG